jgi:pyruvate ferredoxin oxidoreductase delta subunit
MLECEVLRNWRDEPIAGIVREPGTSRHYKTGSWRTYRPIHSDEKCIHCLRCWIYCPDAAVKVKNGKVVAIDYDYCKGCGICAKECPPKASAIEMKLESEFA